MIKTKELRIDRRTARERFFLQGLSFCFKTKSKGPEFDTKKVLEFFFEDGEEVRESKAYTSIQALGALLAAFDLEVVLSEDLNPQTIEMILTVLERIRLSTSGYPNFDDLLQGSAQDGKSSLDPFELKMSRLVAEGSEEDLLHELFVSFYYTNELRKRIPNFQWCYGGIKAAKPTSCAEEPLETKCSCNSNQTVDYLLLENLPGQTMSRALETCSLDQFLNWLAQITLALSLGVSVGFTHYNLHTDNVVVVPAGESKTKVEYWYRNQILVLEVDSFAVLRNFETAHVKHRYRVVGNETSDEDSLGMIINQSEHFGAIGYEHLGIYHNETRPFYDLYKILFWSLQRLQRKNPEVYDETRKITKFFGLSYDRDLKRMLREEAPLGFIYNIEIGPGEKLRSLEEFFSFLVQSYPTLQSQMTIISNFKMVKTLDCHGFCPLRGSVLKDVDVNEKNPLENLGLRGVLNRKWGLEKRIQELERLGGLFCKVSYTDEESGQYCQPATEELMDIRKEYRGFQDLLLRYGQDLYQKALAVLEEERTVTNGFITTFNAEMEAIQNFTDETYRQQRLATDGERLRRKFSLIKGKAVILVKQLALLNEFTAELQITSPIMNIQLLPVLPFP